MLMGLSLEEFLVLIFLATNIEATKFTFKELLPYPDNMFRNKTLNI